MDKLQSNSYSTSPQALKKVKKDILQEAKSEEKYVKNALKDLTHTEKAKQKAEKVATKAELALEKAEKHEQSVIKDVYRAEHKHNMAVADLVQVRIDIQDLTHTERSEQKVASKVENALEKYEKQEQVALKDVYRAEHKHNIAMAEVEKAQNDLQASLRHQDQTKNVLQRKVSHVDEVLAINDGNTQTRNIKLNALRGPSGANEAGRVIAGFHALDPRASTPTVHY